MKISALQGFPIYLQLCLVESLWELDLKVVFKNFDAIDPERYRTPLLAGATIMNG